MGTRLRASRGEQEGSGGFDLLDHRHSGIQSSLHPMPTPSQYEALQLKGSSLQLKGKKTVALVSIVKLSVLHQNSPLKESIYSLVSRGT